VIDVDRISQILRLYYAEHWKIGTIATELGVHRDTVAGAIGSAGFHQPRPRERACLTDPYVEFLEQTLEKHPRLRATRLFEMVRDRGYAGSVVQLRRVVARLRPVGREAFLRRRTFPGEEGQVDWAHFGTVPVERGERRLSCFVLVLSWSRAMHLEFFYDQLLESFLLGHVHAFEALGGAPRVLLVDNLKSAVLERLGSHVRLHPRYAELCGHYATSARPCRPARGNEKGRVERAIRYVRESFFAGRRFGSLDELNAQAIEWRDRIAHARPHPDQPDKTVAELWAEERGRLLPIRSHAFETDRLVRVRSRREIYVRFDGNDYSIPPQAVGKELVVAASPSLVRILDRSREIARHVRSWQRHETIEDLTHVVALVDQKRAASDHAPRFQLETVVPEATGFLEKALHAGHSVAVVARRLASYLDLYGKDELAAALLEAIAKKTFDAASVLFLLERRRRSSRRKPREPVEIPRRPDLARLHLKTRSMEIYDDLAQDPENSDSDD
jgi:transposase